MYFTDHEAAERSTWTGARRWEHRRPIRERDVQAYIERGFSAAEAERWLDSEVTPDDATEFERIGLSPIEAQWMGRPPTVARAWLAAGFDPIQANYWIAGDFAPEEAEVYFHAGWEVDEARALRQAHGRQAGAAIVWALTGLSPREALARAEARENPLRLLSFRAASRPDGVPSITARHTEVTS